MGSSSSIIITFTFIVTFTLMPLNTYSIPFLVFHGISDACNHQGVARFTELLSNWTDSQGNCIEIGDGAWNSWFMPMHEQVFIACEKVKKISDLKAGYNIVGLSQVKNLISLAGPHAGIASVPFCGEHLAPANYIKIPTDIDDYRKGCKFLPELNNEFHKNATYKKRFESLQNLFEQDKVLVPRETSFFGYFPDGSWSTILPAEETMLYKEDWIGLKTLNEAGKVKFVNVTGHHLQIYVSDMKKYILPYLMENKSAQVTNDSWLPFKDSPNTFDWQEGEERLVLHQTD